MEKFAEWTDPAKPLPHQAVDRDQLLALVSVCWFTGTGASSAHFTYEGMQAFAEFMKENAPRPRDRQSARTAGGRRGLRRGPQHPRPARSGAHLRFVVGATIAAGHFPAMETPDLLVGELRRFFASVS